MSLRRLNVLLLILSTALGSTACKEKKESVQEETQGRWEHPAIEFTDARGKVISLKDPAIKIVSLLPSITEYIFELNKGELLIGRSEWCRFPEQALKVEVVGELDKAVDERLIELKPDVVLVSRMMPEEQVQHIESLGFTVVVFDQQNWDTILRDLEVLGKILGNSGDVKTLISWLKRKRQIVANEINELPASSKMRTAVLYSLKPLYTAGKGTFVDEFIQLSGGENVVSDLSSPWPAISMEGLLRTQPEVLLISSEAGQPEELENAIRDFANDPLWSQINAIQNNRVYILDGNTLAVPGPRQVVALAQIASALHPDLFEVPAQLQHVNLRQTPALP